MINLIEIEVPHEKGILEAVWRGYVARMRQYGPSKSQIPSQLLQHIAYPQTAAHAVFMKAAEPVGSAIVNTVNS